MARLVPFAHLGCPSSSCLVLRPFQQLGSSHTRFLLLATHFFECVRVLPLRATGVLLALPDLVLFCDVIAVLELADCFLVLFCFLNDFAATCILASSMVFVFSFRSRSFTRFASLVLRPLECFLDRCFSFRSRSFTRFSSLVHRPLERFLDRCLRPLLL